MVLAWLIALAPLINYYTLNHTVVGILCLLNIWWCAYASPWVPQSDASIRHAAWAPRWALALKGLQRHSELALTSDFNQQHFLQQQYWPSLVHLSVLTFLCTVFGQRWTTTTTTQGPQKVGFWVVIYFMFLCILGTLPKYLLVSPKIFECNHTADPLSCVLDYKYYDSNPMD